MLTQPSRFIMSKIKKEVTFALEEDVHRYDVPEIDDEQYLQLWYGEIEYEQISNERLDTIKMMCRGILEGNNVEEDDEDHEQSSCYCTVGLETPEEYDMRLFDAANSKGKRLCGFLVI